MNWHQEESVSGIKTTIQPDVDSRKTTPLVSVCLITFNHAPYIRECLDSLLRQQTDFPYEICIGEDGSSDGTREICIEYAEKHSERIRLFLRSRVEAERVSYLSNGVYNYIETSKACRGKYVAHCDGDDVWLDALKLQKQADIMEANPDVSLVHSDFEPWDEESGRRRRLPKRRDNRGLHEDSDEVRLRCNMVCMQYHIAASSTFMRRQDILNIFDENQEIFRVLPMGDTPTWCELMDYGSFYYINEPLIARRYLSESDSGSKSAERKFKFVNGASNLGLILGEKYRLPMDVVRANKIKNCNRYALMSGDLKEITELYANQEYRFPWMERLIFQISRLPLLRTMTRQIFQMRYTFNNMRFRMF